MDWNHSECVKWRTWNENGTNQSEMNVIGRHKWVGYIADKNQVSPNGHFVRIHLSLVIICWLIVVISRLLIEQVELANLRLVNGSTFQST